MIDGNKQRVLDLIVLHCFRNKWVELRKFHLLFFLALVLQACGKSPAEDWLVGGWIAVDQSCESSNGFIFERTGEWRADGEEGIWKLDGSNLIINVTGTYDESNELKPSKDVYDLHITKFDKNQFTTSANSNAPAINWKRCSFDIDQPSQLPAGQPPSPENTAPQQSTAGLGSLFGRSEQKIIWEWTGGLTYNTRIYGYVVSTPQQCRAMSESLQSYTQKGWKIISSTPNTRLVQNGGSCEGRDIVIEN